MLNYIDAVDEAFDVVVIGGGATGVYIALDAASRGFRTVLFERGDFASGTSSQSTKLIHGGIRYMQQGRIRLVRESMRERKFLLDNAPHLVRTLPIIVPAYSRWQKLKYTAGVMSYDSVSRGFGLGGTSRLNVAETQNAIPGIESAKLRGGIQYLDGQTDDARLALAIAKTAAAHGAAMITYAQVRSLVTHSGKVTGVEAEDLQTGEAIRVSGKAIINATGTLTDDTLTLDPGGSSGLMRWSRGTHIVMDGSLLSGSHGLLIPKTSDGRVVFALPWLGKTLIGTTDVSVESPGADPTPPAEDIEFLVNEISSYLPEARNARVHSAFTGIRPLISNDSSSSTLNLSRSHRILVAKSGLVTVAGGKWTTARLMAAQALSRAAEVAGLPVSRTATESLRIDGFDPAYRDQQPAESLVDEPDSLYGTRLLAIKNLEERWPELASPITPNDETLLPYRLSHAVYAVQEEMAQTLEDVLARRTRSLFLNADATVGSATAVVNAIEQRCNPGAGWGKRELEKIQAVASKYRSETTN